MIQWKNGKIFKKKKPFKGYNKKIHARTGGLSAKGRAKFKRETGANLKRPVTKKPSKLKPGGKAIKRRKSFCARSKDLSGLMALIAKKQEPQEEGGIVSKVLSAVFSYEDMKRRWNQDNPDEPYTRNDNLENGIYELDNWLN